MTTISDVLDVIVDDAWLMTDDEAIDQVVPMQVDEFTCSRCYLIHHRSQLASRRGGNLVCRDCV
jgi:hypothetical protein